MGEFEEETLEDGVGEFGEVNPGDQGYGAPKPRERGPVQFGQNTTYEFLNLLLVFW